MRQVDCGRNILQERRCQENVEANLDLRTQNAYHRMVVRPIVGNAHMHTVLGRERPAVTD